MTGIDCQQNHSFIINYDHYHNVVTFAEELPGTGGAGVGGQNFYTLAMHIFVILWHMDFLHLLWVKKEMAESWWCFLSKLRWKSFELEKVEVWRIEKNNIIWNEVEVNNMPARVVERPLFDAVPASHYFLCLLHTVIRSGRYLLIVWWIGLKKISQRRK